jgi:peptidoglycan/LPS O-acetylase OafA/YrhL
MATAPEQSSAAAPGSTPGPAGLTHVPGLDGIRALCVLAVLAFHNGFGFAVGGYLGVSTFFTLSGYLIGSLLLAERARTGRIDLLAFWRRRTRRLLPAAVAAVSLAVVFALLAGTAEQQASIGGDALASLAYVANWWFLASEQTYAALFSAPSPLLHMWSLAIEEQFYLVLPLVLLAAGGRRRRVWTVVVTLLVATLVLPGLLSASDDWRYYATPARAPELLLGVLVALVLTSGDRRRRLVDSTHPMVLAASAATGVAALGTMAWLWATTPAGTPALYGGGFAAFAVVSATLVLAAHPRRSPVARALALAPLRHLGVLSYGLYLYHWPIFLWLDPARTGLDGWSLFALRLAVSLVLAEASYRWLESPVRARGVVPVGPAALGARFAVPVIAIVAAGAVLVAATAPPPAVDLAGAQRMALDAARSPETAPPAEQPTAPPPTASEPPIGNTTVAAVGPALAADGPLRVAVFGDSTSLMAMFGISRWAAAQPDVTLVPGYTVLGCGLMLAPRRWDDGTVDVPAAGCSTWPVAWREVLRQGVPHVALVQAGVFDAWPRRLADGSWAEPGEAAWHDEVLAEMTEAVDLLAAGGAYALWATMPPPNPRLQTGIGGNVYSAERLAAVAAYNEVVRQLPGQRPDQVAVLDAAAWHASLADDDDEALRPDGLHLGTGGTDRTAAELYGPALRQTAQLVVASGRHDQLLAAPRALEGQLPGLRALSDDAALRVVVWGEDAAEGAAEEVRAWAARRGREVEVHTVLDQRCGVPRAVARNLGGAEEAVPVRCRSRLRLWEAVTVHQPHAVVMAGGRWESVTLRPWPGDRWWGVDELPHQMWVASEYGGLAEHLRAAGVAVVLARTPAGGAIDRTEKAHDETNRLLARVAGSPWRTPWMTLTDLGGGGTASPATAPPAPTLSAGLDRLTALLPRPA